MADNEIEILIKAEVKKAVAEMNKAKKATEDIKFTTDNLTKGLGALRTGFLLMATVIGSQVFGALVKMKNEAEDFLDLNDDFNRLFADTAKEASSFRDTLVKSFGLSTLEATKYLTTAQEVAVNMGLTGKSALSMSENIAQLTQVLALSNTRGLDASAVNNILLDSIQRNTRGLTDLGFSISDAEIKQEALRQGTAKANGELDQSARSQAVLALLISKTSQATKDFSLANLSAQEKAQVLSNTIKDVRLGIGLAISNAFTPMNEVLFKMSRGGTLDFFYDASVRVLGVIKLMALPVTTLFTLLTGLGQVLSNGKQAFADFGQTVVLSFSVIGSALSGNLTEAKKTFDELKKVASRGAGDFAQGVFSILDAQRSAIVGSVKDIIIGGKTVTSATEKDQKDRTDASNKGNKERLEGDIKTADQIASELKARQETLNNYLGQTERDAENERYRQALESAKSSASEIERVKDQHVNNLIAISNKEFEAQKQSDLQKVQSVAGYVQTVSSQVSNLASAIINLEQQELANYQAIQNQKIEEQTSANEQLIADQLASGQISEEQAQKMRDENIKNEKESKKKIQEETKKQQKQIAEQNKALAVFNSIIGGAQAVIQAFAQGGPILAAIVAGLVAAQVAIIASTPLPAFAKGGIVDGPTALVAGEKGREAILPNYLTEFLISSAQASNGNGGGGMTINIGKVVADNPEQFQKQMDTYMRTRGREVPT